MPERRPLHILFFLRAINFDRVFECFLRELLSRGHRVEVVFDREKGGLPADRTKLFDTIRADHPQFSYEAYKRPREWWLAGATALRYALDYLRYLEPEYAEADALRDRAAERVPRTLRAVIDSPAGRSEPARRLLGGVLRSLEAAVPVSATLRRFVRERSPDVVLVSPLVGLGESQADYLRAAAAEGIPTVLPVASWDNLTNKGLVRDAPASTIVWNESQVREAVQLQRIPAERVVAVGAHTWDHWFSWQPSTTLDEFTEKVGLTPGRQFALYVCSSRFIAGDEVGFIEDWLAQLRGSEHEELRELGIVVRPHPQNVEFWQSVELSDPGRTVVYPRGGAAPTDDERKRDYYDSLWHSRAVVGINTSALLEASIVRRPVLTVVGDRFRGTQQGTIHFGYLVGEDGLLVVAESWEEHLAQLREVLHEPDLHRPRLERFLETFVRPRGLETAAAPLAADEVERAATDEALTRQVSPLARVVVAPVAAVVGVLATGRPSRRLGKAVRRRVAVARAAASAAARRL